ncbi:uncharacterized protein BDW47DRAFT_65020 [Aspergillus candidus]|uniref:Uncharacterized protein n=1 Tax=Aspergillus candidus TaxID=41067 RepID=A0A2I2FKN0_ASPCN|nr:hypothetical protein BDW47DRAFT_65020 [Aspergillus candidus]PLB41179.1 hypothetical protein BDW47DRAFT_65020 [Aspergillus candidus]
MAFPQQGLSRTLPKNFTFPSMSFGEPRTPERSSIQLEVPPPPPRHASCRWRRSRARSGSDIFAQVEYDRSTVRSTSPDVPLPSIEIPPSCEPAENPSSSIPPPHNVHLLAPPRHRVALKTPPAQIRPDPADPPPTDSWRSDDPQLWGDAIERPGSACSHASDSSISSIETYASRRSVGGSCTSMESDSYDPFFHLEIAPKPLADSPPLPRKPWRPRGLRSKEKWTLDMDNHLWNTYQLYIQNPLITPFKMTPGSIPPLGVTHRVAREAKRNWERKRFRLTQHPSAGPSAPAHQSRSGDATPTPKAEPATPIWPRSEAATRRRLKLLCKRKFSIAPHYQRMMQSKSPSPALDLLPRIEPESAGNNAAYATRDLGVSLVTSSVPTPLSQLAAEGPSHMTNPEWHPLPSAEPRSLPPKSWSFDEQEMEAPRLGSPFAYNTWGPNTSRHRIHRPGSRRETIHVTGARLRSLPRMDALPTAEHQHGAVPRNDLPADESPAQDETQRHLEELFRQGKLNDFGQRRIRLRTRGATTSAVHPPAINQLFSPPSSSSRNDERGSTDKLAIPSLLNHLDGDAGENIRRLGSPFKIETPKRPGPTRRIRHAPSLSDPFIGRSMNPQPKLATPDSQGRSRARTGVLPYDPTERGISDAERIRRQILNLPYTKQ